MDPLGEHVAYAVVIARAYERLTGQTAGELVLRGDHLGPSGAVVVGNSDEEVIASIGPGDPGWEELAGLWKIVAPPAEATLYVDMDLNYRLDPPDRLLDIPDAEQVASAGDQRQVR